jgi:hypothetical protein
MARWHSANVLQSSAGGRRLWNLSSSGGKFTVQSEATLLLNEPCPPEWVGKDWQTLFRKKLNVAWLPADKVFFRALQLPSSDPAELASMVELQLEKVSPLPVTHIVWSIYLAPRPADKPDTLQTVIVIIAARSAVEEFLGQLETEGFLADRLEAPGLEQFLATPITSDGVWIFTGNDGDPALAVWSFNGIIHNITLVTLPAGPERGAQLRVQLEQTAWASELEGWLTGPMNIHLLTTPDQAGYWEPIFKGWGDFVETLTPPAPKDLAARSADRCANGAVNTSLLPPEFAVRYQQQFVDRLWMRSLVAVAAVYILGVLFYFGMLYVFQMKTDRVKAELKAMGGSYTNGLRNIEQINILETRAALKFAALDCWKAVAENLPDSMTVDNMFFQRGKLELSGTIVSDNPDDVGTFNDALRTSKGAVTHDLLFSDVSAPTTVFNGGKGTWRFSCVLKQAGENE